MAGHSGRIGTGLHLGVLRLTAMAAVLLVASCAATYQTHGYVPPERELAALQPGVDTLQTVTETVGEPTAQGVLGEQGLYYVESRFRHFGPFAPEEVSREIVTLTFDQGGVLRNLERYGLEDGNTIVLSRRVTDETVRNSTFLRQLVGNIGNFDAGTFIGEE